MHAIRLFTLSNMFLGRSLFALPQRHNGQYPLVVGTRFVYSQEEAQHFMALYHIAKSLSKQEQDKSVQDLPAETQTCATLLFLGVAP